MTSETSKMPIRVETVLGPLTWQSDQTGFEVTFPGRTARCQWDEITAAGLVESAMPMARAGVPAPVLGGLGKYLPGLGQLTRINEHLAENYRTLVLARGPNHTRAIRIPLPLADEEAAELAHEVHQRLADRWVGDIEIGDSYQRLGLRQPWWTIPFSILFFIALGLTMSLTCVGVTAIFEGSFNLPLAVWIGMAVWFILIGSIIFLYRRLWLR
jgi:hypothetical protein